MIRWWIFMIDVCIEIIFSSFYIELLLGFKSRVNFRGVYTLLNNFINFIGCAILAFNLHSSLKLRAFKMKLLDSTFLWTRLIADEHDFVRVVFKPEDITVEFHCFMSWNLLSLQSIQRHKLIIPIQSQQPQFKILLPQHHLCPRLNFLHLRQLPIKRNLNLLLNPIQNKVPNQLLLLLPLLINLESPPKKSQHPLWHKLKTYWKR